MAPLVYFLYSYFIRCHRPHCFLYDYFILEKIRPLRGHLPFITAITAHEFGFDINSDGNDLEGIY